MGDVVSSHLDEAKREIISAQTGEVMTDFGRLYEQQYAVALFNNVRFDIEGGGGPQPQLLHRKIPLENKSIFSGSLFQYLEENKKWRNRFLFIPDTYNINYYDNKSSHDKHLHPKGTINCAGYKVLTSMEQYMDLISNSLPGVKAKLGSSPFLKCATQFPLILWHPYARHHCFCVTTEKEQQKWHAVLQDCVRHTNDGLSEENKVQTPAFTDAVRLYRQAQGQYGTWDMMCGVPSQILSNLVMESLLPKLRELISPRLKGKLHDRQRNWMLISDAVYSLVQGQCQTQYEALLKKCEAARSSLEASIRTDMDQIITSKEHVTNKIRAVVLPKAEKLLKVSIQPYISSILDALMEPTSRGFFEIRDLFFRELVDMSKNTLNEGTKETVAQHMEKISMLAYHPVKMQSCYEKVEQLSLEGLQQRFDVSSPSVFVQRVQILMREQMDDAVYTFEQILHQSLEAQGTEELCKTIQRCQDRVIKKYDYDSSTVRKRFFREALLQIFIPYMLKQLSPSCGSELPRFQELIFEDFSRFILVESIFEEVVLHSVMKDIMMAVKEAAVQRRHNLYRDSIVLSNSDPSLHLLGENPSIDWAGEYGGAQEEAESTGEDAEGEGEESYKRKRMKQVVSMIQVEGSTVLPNESCREVPGVNDIPEEEEEEEMDGEGEENSDGKVSPVSPKASENPPDLSNGSISMEKDKPEGKEVVPLKVETAAENTSVVQEEKDGGGEEKAVEKAAPASPKASENPPDLSNGSILTEEEAKPEGKEEVPLKVETAAESASVVQEEKDGGGEEKAVEKDAPASPKASENPPDLSNGSISTEEKDKPEGKEEVPLKVETAAESASVVQEEKDGGGEEKAVEKAAPASPKASENPPDLSNGSILTEEEAKPEGKEEVLLKVETAAESASVVQEEKEGGGEENSDSKASPVSPKASENPPDFSNGSISTEEGAKPEGKEEVPPKVETTTESDSVIQVEKDGGGEENSDSKASPVSPKASENPPDFSNGSISTEEGAKPEGKEEVPLKVETVAESASVVELEKDGGGKENLDEKAAPASPKASENPPDLSNGSISMEEKDKPEGKEEVPLKVETAAESASVVQEEKDGGGEEKAVEKDAPASPKASENPPDLSNGSISTEEKDKPEGKEEVPLKVETPTESASVVEEEKGKEEQPQSNQEVSEEALPPPPPSEEIPSRGTEMAPESPPEETSDFPPPPHDDSGFQSPSSEGGEAEEEAPGTVAPQPAEENPEVMEKRVSAEPETKTSDSETRDQRPVMK